MSRTELIELLARVSLNVDEEIRMMAQQTMVNLIIESPAYRQRTIQGQLFIVLSCLISPQLTLFCQFQLSYNSFKNMCLTRIHINLIVV